MVSKLNAEWHNAHRMPKNPKEAERLAWHIEHAKHCACRPIPPKLARRLEDAGLGQPFTKIP